MRKLIRSNFGKNNFSKRVVELALSVPMGKVTTYGRIARAAGGGPMASQSITGILGKAFRNGEVRIPFHRIVYANGKVWINDKYRKERLRLYKKEGIRISKDNKIENFEKVLIEFK
jgi:methylated-DNA-protein-cysteine methyltransferase related protein